MLSTNRCTGVELGEPISRSVKLAPWIRNALMPLIGAASHRATHEMLEERF